MKAEPTVLAGQLARLGWSGPDVLRFERSLQTNKEALALKEQVRRGEAELYRFYLFVLARRGEAEPWKKRCRRR